MEKWLSDANEQQNPWAQKYFSKKVEKYVPGKPKKLHTVVEGVFWLLAFSSWLLWFSCPAFG
jgi:hypothetical protein